MDSNICSGTFLYMSTPSFLFSFAVKKIFIVFPLTFLKLIKLKHMHVSGELKFGYTSFIKINLANSLGFVRDNNGLLKICYYKL
jgi:hypothetical protein